MNKLLISAALVATLTSAALPSLAGDQTTALLAMNDIAPSTWAKPVAMDPTEAIAEDTLASTLEETNKQLNERMAEQFERDISVPTL